MNIDNVPREKIPWYPTVDASKCIGCGLCVDFCHNKVYTKDDAKRAVVSNPYGCVVGCSYCSTDICSHEAITFPSLEWLKEHMAAIAG